MAYGVVGIGGDEQGPLNADGCVDGIKVISAFVLMLGFILWAGVASGHAHFEPQTQSHS